MPSVTPRPTFAADITPPQLGVPSNTGTSRCDWGRCLITIHSPAVTRDKRADAPRSWATFGRWFFRRIKARWWQKKVAANAGNRRTPGETEVRNRCKFAFLILFWTFVGDACRCRSCAGRIERSQTNSSLVAFHGFVNFATNEGARDHIHNFGQVGIHADRSAGSTSKVSSKNLRLH